MKDESRQIKETQIGTSNIISTLCVYYNRFQTSALQQSKVSLTWDETDVRRRGTTMRQISETEINETDFTELLASTDEDEDDEVDNVNEGDDVTSAVSTKEKRAERYRALVDTGTNVMDDRCELEVTWQPGLQEITSERTVDQERSTADLTPWEKYLNRQKKNQMERRKKHKNVSETNETKSIRSSINMTVGFDDPFFEDHDDTKSTTLPNSQTKKRSKKTKSKLTEEEQRQQEELELLVTGGSNKKAHFSLKGILAQENLKKKLKKKRRMQEQEPDDFQISLDDPRFEVLFTSNEYAVDPSNPRFKNTKAMQAVVEERRRKRSLSSNHESIPNSTTSVVSEDNLHKVQRGKESLSLLAQSVKAKTERFLASKRQS
jgi:hypothetical protein